MSFQSVEGKDGDWTEDKHCAGCSIEEIQILVEGEAMVGPVGKVGRGVNGAKPDHQPDEGEGVQDHPGDGDGQHLGVVFLSAPKRALCKDGHIGETVEDATACIFVIMFRVGEGPKGYDECDDNSGPEVDSRVFLEEGADDGDASNLEDEACQEGWRELGHKLQLLTKASLLRD